MMHGGGAAIPLHDVPAVAEVVRRIYDRPPWLRADPLAIEPDLYREARAEYAKALEKRGWPVPYAEMDRDNFLLRGVTVMIGE
jgi:hypothetical protein